VGKIEVVTDYRRLDADPARDRSGGDPNQSGTKRRSSFFIHDTDDSGAPGPPTVG
jgi:hypothetical protein